VKNDDRMTDTQFRNATAFLEDMQKMHDFLVDHPFIIKNQDWYPIQLNIYVQDKTGLAEMAKELGSADKHESSYYFSLKKMFGKHSIEVNAQRDKVCTKIKVGTKISEKYEPEALELAMAAVPKIEVEEDIFEWQCPESILKD
jgi:hypothetical protein